MSEKQDMGVVTQADIDAAQGYIDAFNRDGINSKHKLAQHFAAHRLASQADQTSLIRNQPFDPSDDYPDVRRDERERIVAALGIQADQGDRVMQFLRMLATRTNSALPGQSQHSFLTKRLREIKRDAAYLLDTLSTQPQPSQKGEGDE